MISKSVSMIILAASSPASLLAQEIRIESKINLACDRGAYSLQLELKNVGATSVKLPGHLVPVATSGQVASYQAFEMAPDNYRELGGASLVATPPPYIEIDPNDTFYVDGFAQHAFHGFSEALDRNPVILLWKFDDYRGGGVSVSFSGQVRGLIYFPRNRRFFPDECPTIVALEDS